MPTYNTPGVYVEEIPTLPPSVAEVATAVPAFVGYTKIPPTGDVQVTKIRTLLEFEEAFGGAEPTAFTAAEDGTLTPLATPVPVQPLWYAINLYFRNGGGPCYVVAVGSHADDPAAADFEAGIDELEKWDEPTLVVVPGAVGLGGTDYASVCQKALAHCNTMKDRFTILDVRAGDVDAFRTAVGLEYLMYGAAYHPYLETSLSHVYDEDTSVVVAAAGGNVALSALKTTRTALYNQIKKNLVEQRVVLPPSAAMAGIYARTDRDRGVWKAPANVSIASVIRPTTMVTADEQDSLNVDTNAGKSINAIRAFAGKGTVVWGARTLAGNDNEWRYINVRRLFIMIEESAKNASSFAVFESNDSTTWLKVKGMLEAYLYGLWERGALQGAKPDDAYGVHVGLGKTMTPQDILDGKLIVRLMIAAVRPAEFIELRFSHKLAQSS